MIYSYGFEVRRSIQLSYGRMLERTAEIGKQITDPRLTASPRRVEVKKGNLVPDSTQNYNHSRLYIKASRKQITGQFPCPVKDL
jgi:hypothetical protein